MEKEDDMAMRDLIPFSRHHTNAPSLWQTEFSPLTSFRREVDRLFDDFFRTPTLDRFGEFSGGLMTNWPSVEVKDKNNEVVVTAEVPGMSDKDVELFVDNGMLTIRGEKKGEKDEKGYSEHFYGRFERHIPIPTSVDEQHCKAEFHNGLLTIHLPKSREAEEARKRIPINTDTRH
jgi:HSP20 family protein